MSILVVDDNQDVMDMYQTYFDMKNLNWKTFSNGFDALAFIEENADVEAILLDLAMPIVDGITTMQDARLNENLHPDRDPLRIAFLTAHDKSPPIERIMKQDHVEKYFKKPISPEDLVSEVGEWLRRD